MGKGLYIKLFALTMISGIIAGATSGHIFSTKAAIGEGIGHCETLTVAGLRIVDEKGDLIMKLGRKDGSAHDHGLYIYDSSGRIACFISTGSPDGAIGVFGKGYMGGTVIMIDGSGGAVDIFGRDGVRSVRIGTDESGNGAISLWDKNGCRLR